MKNRSATCEEIIVYIGYRGWCVVWCREGYLNIALTDFVHKQVACFAGVELCKNHCDIDKTIVRVPDY